MSSLSKASHGAFEALKALNPFSGFSRDLEVPEQRRPRNSMRSSDARPLQSHDLYSSGMVRTLRSVASLFYLKDCETDVVMKQVHDGEQVGHSPRRKSSTKSLRGLFHKESRSHLQKDFKDSESCEAMDCNLFVQPPPYAQSEAPKLDVDIPAWSIRTRAGGFATNSGTDLIDPSEFAVHDSQHFDDKQHATEAPLAGKSVAFELEENKVSSSASLTSPEVMSSEDRLPNSPALSSKGEKFPIRSRLSMKKSLDRLHSKISRVWPPATPIRASSLQPSNESSPEACNDTSVPTMGSRNTWLAIRDQRRIRYEETMGCTQTTESDDVSDKDLKLCRHETASPIFEKGWSEIPTSYSHEMFVYTPADTFRFAVEASCRKSGPELDNPDSSTMVSGESRSTQSTKHSSCHTPIISATDSSSRISSTSCCQHVDKQSSTPELVRGRSMERAPSAQRSSMSYSTGRHSPQERLVISQDEEITSDTKIPVSVQPFKPATGQVDAENDTADDEGVLPERFTMVKLSKDIWYDKLSSPGIMRLKWPFQEIWQSTDKETDEWRCHYPNCTAHLTKRDEKGLAIPDSDAGFLKRDYSIHDPAKPMRYIQDADLTLFQRHERRLYNAYWEGLQTLDQLYRDHGKEGCDLKTQPPKWDGVPNPTDEVWLKCQKLRKALDWHEFAKDYLIQPDLVYGSPGFQEALQIEYPNMVTWENHDTHSEKGEEDDCSEQEDSEEDFYQEEGYNNNNDKVATCEENEIDSEQSYAATDFNATITSVEDADSILQIWDLEQDADDNENPIKSASTSPSVANELVQAAYDSTRLAERQGIDSSEMLSETDEP